MTAPILWICGIIALLTSYFLIGDPEKIQLLFSQKGFAPIELITVGLFYFQILFLWLLPPVPLKPLKAKLLCLNFSIISLIAIARELDVHKKMVDVSHIEGATRGTPFKMRFLTNSINPLPDRLLVLFVFIVVITLCIGTLIWYIRPLLKGLFRFHPVCWSVAFLGGTTILIKIVDRLGSNLRKHLNVEFAEQTKALISVLEEGQELLLPLFVILAIIQSHFIYNNDDGNELKQYNEL